MRFSAVLGLLGASFAAGSQVTFTNSQRLLFDVDGNQIDAYGSKINYFNGSYYLYGNSFAVTGVAFGIKSYSSVDLQNWKYEGFLYDPYSSTPCSETGGCGRPHIIYNAKNHQYVLWANAGSSGYQVATSTSPAGPFTFKNTTAAIDPKFDGLQPADFAVETFGNNAYLVFSALNFLSPDAGSLWPPIFQTMHISQLTDDYLNTTQVSYNVTSSDFDLIDQETESPDLFMRNGQFYVAASNTCGYCNGSIGLLYRSASIKGPWTRQIISGFSCDGQVEGVLPLVNPQTKAVTDVWHSTSVPGGPRTGFSGHIFQPLQFNADGSVQDLNCAADAQFQVAYTPGTAATATGNATKAYDKTPAKAATWTAGESGVLANVSVNIAASVQTVPLALTVFTFDSYADLVAPEYKWTALGSASFNASELSYVFNTATVPVTTNATVKVGQLLGISVSGADFAPYCHLETGSAGTTFRLFQQGSGQNSRRGLSGNIGPVYERFGKTLKMFANYA